MLSPSLHELSINKWLGPLMPVAMSTGLYTFYINTISAIHLKKGRSYFKEFTLIPSVKGERKIREEREIIVYSRSTINVCSLLSHEWWTPLIKFMVGPTIHVRGMSTHLWYSGST